MVSYDDDIQHFFWHFFVAKQELWLCTFYIVIAINGAPTLAAVRHTTMNMGARTASKIACRFADEWLAAWRRQMDIYVREVWLLKQTKELREALLKRAQDMGPNQAQPF